MSKKENRFIITHKERGFATETTVLVDRKTGINYLFHHAGYAGGLTPLLDRDGKPIVIAVPDEED